MDDPMIKEMEVAFASVPLEEGSTREERIKDIERKKKEQREAVNRAVQKYFPEGIKAEEAFTRLRQMKERGFDVSEYRHEGARNWPDGEFKPHHERNRRSIQLRYQNDVSGYIATKDYSTEFHLRMGFITKHVAISFRVIDGSGVISDVKGDIGASGV